MGEVEVGLQCAEVRAWRLLVLSQSHVAGHAHRDGINIFAHEVLDAELGTLLFSWGSRRRYILFT